MIVSKSSYNGNNLLRPSGVPIEFTAEQVTEWIKCRDDPIYFVTKYVKIVTLDHGLQPMNPYDFQKEIITKALTKRKLIVKTARQAGKCHSQNTKYRIRNKQTQEIIEITAAQFHELSKSKNVSTL